MRNLGIILAILGIAMMLITGFSLVTTKKVVDLGPIEINKEQKTPINWSPIVGAALLIGGIALIVTDKRKA